MDFVDQGISLAGLGGSGRSGKRERQQVRQIRTDLFRQQALERQSAVSSLQLFGNPRGGGTLGGPQSGSRSTLG